MWTGRSTLCLPLFLPGNIVWESARSMQLWLNTCPFSCLLLIYRLCLQWWRVNKPFKLKDTHGVRWAIVQPDAYLQKLRVQARLFEEVRLFEAMSVQMIDQEPDLLGYGIWVLSAAHLFSILLQYIAKTKQWDLAEQSSNLWAKTTHSCQGFTTLYHLPSSNIEI